MKSKTIDQYNWWKRLRENRYIRISLLVAMGVLLYILMLGNIIPDKIEIRLSQAVDQDIRSPITVENKAATEDRRKEAVTAIGPVYDLKQEYAQNQVGKVDDIFELVRQVAADYEAEQEALKERLEEELEEGEEVEIETRTDEEILEEQLAYIHETLAIGTSNELSDETIITLLESSDSQLQIAQEATANAVFDIMNEQISIRDLTEKKEEVENSIEMPTLSNRLVNAMQEIASFAIIPNYIYDAEETERLRQATADSVEPVMIREGQLIVKEGEIVNHEIYEQLRLVGLLDDDLNVYPYIGLAILVILIMSVIGYHINEANTSLRHNNSHLVMFTLIFVLTVVLIKVFSLLEGLGITGLGYAVPVSVGAMLLTLLLSKRVAVFMSFIFAVIGSIFFNYDTAGAFNFTYGIYLFFSSISAAFFLGESNRVSRILRAGLYVSAVNILTVLSLLFMKVVPSGWVEIGIHVGFVWFSGFVAAVLTLGLLPFFEVGFGILSTTRLIELSNPNHPLLRRILTEAPGTYHHSVVVGNLAESASESIGENGLLARVASYYHDLGKTKRPHFFIENQMRMENPHDKISPQLSTTIITAHPYDGADLLRKHKMPKEIIDIAEQHHGTTLLKFFYHKANQDSETSLPESQFRYPGPKSQTKVGAIVQIADSVEAAVRSMQKPTPDKIENLVRKIIKDKLEDGQFDESDLTLRELDQVAISICETLKGTFHQRIEYPEDEKKKGD
ncbi:HD family phosphohydrolase [Alkalihalobacillus sp. 1P02AB]|uniref:HD family phosphohydrolase n=1 Tax=Alkalihalobacillus sp. 1P02AB TaxID=3132260 RepID=UPI0039A510A5